MHAIMIVYKLTDSQILTLKIHRTQHGVRSGIKNNEVN